MKEYFLLTIHRDDHHCGSCWEASDESDEFIIAETEEEAIKKAAQSLALCSGRRQDFSMRKALGGELNGSIHLLYDPVSKEYSGKGTEFDASRIFESAYFAEAMAEKKKAAIEAKAREEKQQAADAIRYAKAKEREERKKLEELKAKYENKTDDEKISELLEAGRPLAGDAVTDGAKKILLDKGSQ